MRNDETYREVVSEMAELVRHETEMEDVCVESSDEDVDDHRQIVSVISKSNAASAEPAVMVPLQDTDVADLAMMATRRLIDTALLAVRPVALFRTSETVVRAGFYQLVEVGKRVDVQEGCKYVVKHDDC